MENNTEMMPKPMECNIYMRGKCCLSYHCSWKSLSGRTRYWMSLMEEEKSILHTTEVFSLLHILLRQIE